MAAEETTPSLNIDSMVRVGTRPCDRKDTRVPPPLTKRDHCREKPTQPLRQDWDVVLNQH